VFILLLALPSPTTPRASTPTSAPERATLFAFGMPLRRVLGLEIAEGLLIGLLGTAVAVGAGLVLNRWIITSTWSRTMPDLGLDIVVSAGTVLTALALGVIAVGVAPLLTTRRLRRMDIPGTLRVVE
jgi:putative ABC transport system permease protein